MLNCGKEANDLVQVCRTATTVPGVATETVTACQRKGRKTGSAVPRETAGDLE